MEEARRKHGKQRERTSCLVNQFDHPLLQFSLKFTVNIHCHAQSFTTVPLRSV